MEDKVSVFLFVAPVLTSSSEKTYAYRLPDMVDGEWIIFEDNKPRYCLYILDDLYKDLREYLQNHKDIDVSTLLAQSFKDKDRSLSLHQTFRVRRFLEKETSQEFKLEKFPPHLFKIE